MYSRRFDSRGAIPGAGGDHDLFAAIFARPATGQLPWADRLHTHQAIRGTVMLSYLLPEQPGRQLDQLIKVLRMAFDDLRVDSRDDV